VIGNLFFEELYDLILNCLYQLKSDKICNQVNELILNLIKPMPDMKFVVFL